MTVTGSISGFLLCSFREAAYYMQNTQKYKYTYIVPLATPPGFPQGVCVCVCARTL